MVARRGGPSWRALAQGLDTPLVGKADVASMIAVDHKTPGKSFVFLQFNRPIT